MTPGVNVLIAAARSDYPHYAGAHAFLKHVAARAAAGSAYVSMPMVLTSFLRLVTSPKILKAPTSVDEAVAFVDALPAIAGVQLAALGPEWPRLRQLCLDKQLSGNSLPDA